MVAPVDGPAQLTEQDKRRRFQLMVANLVEHLSTPLGVELKKQERLILHKFAAQQLRAANLFLRRHLDYGEGNIAKIGEVGLLSRVIDKVARLDNCRGRPTTGESKEDSWMDIANYAIIALMVRAGDWPVEPGHEL